MIAARMGSNPIAKSLLVTFYSEAARVGKDKRNGLSTDDEVVAVGKKFVANAAETAKILKDRGQDCSVQLEEMTIINSYLPKQLSTEALSEAISTIIKGLDVSGPKAMGQVMGKLKSTYGNTYDGKVASELVKSLLS